MSNAGGNRVQPGVITGTVMERYERGVYTAEFDPQFDLWGMAAGAISEAQKISSGVVSQIQTGGAGLVTEAQKMVGSLGQTVTNKGNVYLGSTPVRAAPAAPVVIPKISVPGITAPKLDLPFGLSQMKFELPKITMPEIFGPSQVSDVMAARAGIAGAVLGVFSKPAAASVVASVASPIPIKTIDITGTVTTPVPKPADFWGGVQCGIFGCDGQKSVLTQIGEAVTSPTGPLLKLGGTDFLKGLPSLSDVQKSTQSMATTFALLNPFTAPLAIGTIAVDYAKNLFSPPPASAVSAVTKMSDVPPSTFESRKAAVVAPEKPGAITGCNAENICDPKRNAYGESQVDIAECTIRRGDYIGYKKRYRYTDTFPDICLLSDEVKFYVPLGNYQQQEIHGIPVYTNKGRIEFYDPYTGELIYDANEELQASGAMSVGKPKTSLVTQVWSNEPPVGVAGEDFDAEQAKRFAITEFRDKYSETLEQQISNLNKIKGDYTDVSFSRLGAELYNGKVLPIDGRVLDPSLVTEETDYGKKNGYNFPVNNINKIYGDLGQPELGERVAPGMVAASNIKAASAFPGAATAGVVPGECGFWDVLCKVGKWVSPAAPAMGFVSNSALVITEGVLGGIPSLADAAYDTTTGAIERLRGLETGSLTRLGSRKAFDNLFEKSLGLELDKQSYTKALGMKYTEGEDWLTGATRAGVSLMEEDIMTDPWAMTSMVGAIRFALVAPSLGEMLMGAVTGNIVAEPEYKYIAYEEPKTAQVNAILKTDDPLKVDTSFLTETLPPGAIVV